MNPTTLSLLKFLGASVLHGVSLYLTLTYAMELGYAEAAEEALDVAEAYLKKKEDEENIELTKIKDILDQKPIKKEPDPCCVKPGKQEEEEPEITVVTPPSKKITLV